MPRWLITSLALMLAVGHSFGQDPEDDHTCHLQAKLDTDTNNDVTEIDGCPLPANSRWCQVKLGQSQFSMAVYSSDDIVSNTICSTGTWELQAGDIAAMGTPGHALDIGANIGFYSLVLAASGWTVTAFEPMAQNSELIQASVCANPSFKSKLKLNMFGLGSKDDHCIIISGDDNLGDGVSKCGDEAKQPVPAGYHKRASIDVRRLDDILQQQNVQHIDFVKMDVEGFECQVMAGGQSLLTKFRPKMIQSEVWPTMNGCLPQDYLASYAKADYKVTKDRTCTQPDQSKPTGIVDRFMCQKTGGTASLLEVSQLKQNERTIVWLERA